MQHLYRHCHSQLRAQEQEQVQVLQGCSSGLCSACKMHHQTPCSQQLETDDVPRLQQTCNVTEQHKQQPKHSSDSKQQLQGRNGASLLQQAVGHNPLLLLLLLHLQQLSHQQQPHPQQHMQQQQQQALRDPVLQSLQWSGPSRSCPRSHLPKCSSSCKAARCQGCRRSRFMQVSDSAGLLNASSSIRPAGSKLKLLLQPLLQARNSNSSNHNNGSSSSSKDSNSLHHAGQHALPSSSRRLHSSSSNSNSRPLLPDDHQHTHEQVSRQLCCRWKKALGSPSMTWGPVRCSAATAMPSCGRRKIRAVQAHPMVAAYAAIRAKAAASRTASSHRHS